MTHASHIDVYADDRGLAMCFSVANILPEWSKEIIAKHRWETLEDFVYWFDDVNIEDSLTQVLLTTTERQPPCSVSLESGPGCGPCRHQDGSLRAEACGRP